jgi:hypothetical protein
VLQNDIFIMVKCVFSEVCRLPFTNSDREFFLEIKKERNLRLAVVLVVL